MNVSINLPMSKSKELTVNLTLLHWELISSRFLFPHVSLLVTSLKLEFFLQTRWSRWSATRWGTRWSRPRPWSTSWTWTRTARCPTPSLSSSWSTRSRWDDLTKEDSLFIVIIVLVLSSHSPISTDCFKPPTFPFFFLCSANYYFTICCFIAF